MHSIEENTVKAENQVQENENIFFSGIERERSESRF